MEPNLHSCKARSEARYGVSVKIRNAADVQIWPTGGPLFRPVEPRCARFVAIQATAPAAPGQQTRIEDQVAPYCSKVL